MNMPLRAAIVAVALFAQPFRAQTEAPPVPETVEELVSVIGAAFDDPEFAHAHYGAYIESLDSGDVLFELNADKVFMPASNEKIITSATAFVKLGADYRFATEIRATGEVRDSVLFGDLVVVGSGDPSLYEVHYEHSRDVFRAWADSFKARGVSTIAGDVVGYDDLFDDEPYGYGWPFDGFPYWYSTEIGPLQINENYVDIMITPPEDATSQPTIEPNMPSDYFTIVDNSVVVDTGRTTLSAFRPHGANVIYLEGAVLAGSPPFMRSPTITNPTLFYATVLTETLEEEGVRTLGEPRDGDDSERWNFPPQAFDSLFTHYAPPLAELNETLMKRSQNLYAESFARALGLEYRGLGSFENGKKVVEEFLDSLGIEPGTYAYNDGSGLSRYNFVAPRQLATILRAMSDREEWIRGLPVAGEDGTLRNRMKDTPAAGAVQAKTGTISNTRALSGYATAASGERFVFSFIFNAHLLSSRDVDRITDGVLATIARFEE
jgi:D-alanyl-D-alanine carboxypeptidase/D-alanyl-D-alanine-endopeptidase (penicillin-binding protein 4)